MKEAEIQEMTPLHQAKEEREANTMPSDVSDISGGSDFFDLGGGGSIPYREERA
jgi:hypothetical protein